MPKKNAGEIVELGVSDDDFAVAADRNHGHDRYRPPTPPPRPPVTPVDRRGTAAATTSAAAAAAADGARRRCQRRRPLTPRPPRPPYLAQLLSTLDQKTAEALAVKLINRGFNTAYVERGTTEQRPRPTALDVGGVEAAVDDAYGQRFGGLLVAGGEELGDVWLRGHLCPTTARQRRPASSAAAAAGGCGSRGRAVSVPG